MPEVDPYNYPFLQKNETMYLSTISIGFIMQANKISSHHKQAI